MVTTPPFPPPLVPPPTETVSPGAVLTIVRSETETEMEILVVVTV